MTAYKNYSIDAASTFLTVAQYLKQLNYSGRQLQRLTHSCALFVNRRPTFLQHQLKTGDVLSLKMPADTDCGLCPESGSLSVLYEDEHLIILDKPAGMLVHPAGQTSAHTLANYLAGYLQSKQQSGRIHPLHRLDRDTSGCVLFAKSASIQAVLEQALRAKSIIRRYSAFVQGIPLPAQGTITANIGRCPGKPNQRRIDIRNGEPAVTHYTTIYGSTACSMLSLTLGTGRTHQIRIHLAHIGHPVIGDKMYGSRSPLIRRQALHASQLELIHPISREKIAVTAPLPPDMNRLLQYLN